MPLDQDIAECREVDRIMKMSEQELAADLAKDGETLESAAAIGRAAFERALAKADAVPSTDQRHSEIVEGKQS